MFYIFSKYHIFITLGVGAFIKLMSYFSINMSQSFYKSFHHNFYHNLYRKKILCCLASPLVFLTSNFIVSQILNCFWSSFLAFILYTLILILKDFFPTYFHNHLMRPDRIIGLRSCLFFSKAALSTPIKIGSRFINFYISIVYMFTIMLYLSLLTSFFILSNHISSQGLFNQINLVKFFLDYALYSENFFLSTLSYVRGLLWCPRDGRSQPKVLIPSDTLQSCFGSIHIRIGVMRPYRRSIFFSPMARSLCHMPSFIFYHVTVCNGSLS